jgi:uncharacterized membrane protein YfcA
MEATELVVIALIYALAGTVHGLIGFAFAVVAVPLISLIHSPVVAVGMTIVIGPLLMLYNTWLHRGSVAFRGIVPLMLVGLIFVPIGAIFLRRAPEDAIMITLGAVLVLMTLFATFAAERTSAVLGFRPVGYGFSVLAGFIAGAFTSGGPPIVAYLYNADRDRLRAKANSQLFFAVFAITGLISHSTTGVVTAERALYALPLFPVAFFSIRFGAYLSRRLPAQTFRWITDGGLLLLGAYLIVTHL